MRVTPKLRNLLAVCVRTAITTPLLAAVLMSIWTLLQLPDAFRFDEYPHLLLKLSLAIFVLLSVILLFHFFFFERKKVWVFQQDKLILDDGLELKLAEIAYLRARDYAISVPVGGTMRSIGYLDKALVKEVAELFEKSR